MPHPRFGQRGDVERPADRRRGDSTCEMHQIADESPRPGERKISPFRLVHPCTSRGLRRRRLSDSAQQHVARRLLDAGRFDPAGRIEAYRKSPGGEGEGCKNESRARLGRTLSDGSGMAGPDRATGPMTRPGMDFPECVAYAIIVVAFTAKGFRA